MSVFGWGSKYYGLLTNNSEVAKLVTSHAKAVSFLVGRETAHFRRCTPAEADVENHAFCYVFRDWLNVAPGKVLIDLGCDIEDCRALFRY